MWNNVSHIIIIFGQLILTAIVGSIKRAYIWCKRFRHRRGYGVHSPLAFEFITQVVYEKAHYYAYERLKSRSDRLVFRIVNYAQPQFALEVGGDALPIELAKPSAEVVRADSADIGRLDEMGEIGFAHISADVANYEKWCEALLPHFGRRSILVIDGIYSDREKREWWRRLINDERTGIAFDLYSAGVVMFDMTRIKQNYIVNY